MRTRKLDRVENIERAMRLAHVAHAGQVNDKNGEDYIDHPTRVADYFRIQARAVSLDDEDYNVGVQAAWLHDVFEDTSLSPKVLLNLGFDVRVVSIVSALTRHSGVKDAYYYAGIRQDEVAKLVKLADLTDNTDPGRLSRLDEATQQRLARKYERAYRELGFIVPEHIERLAGK